MAKIKENAAAYDISLDQVAEKSGYTRQQLDLWSLHDGDMTLDQALDIAQTISPDLTLDELLFGRAHKPVMLEGLTPVQIVLLLSLLQQRRLHGDSVDPASLLTRGERVKYARKVIGGYTQKEFGEFVDRTRSCVENWESGEGPLRLNNLVQVSLMTGVSMEWLAKGGPLSLAGTNIGPSERRMIEEAASYLRSGKVLSGRMRTAKF